MKIFDFSVFNGALWRISERHIQEGERCDAKNTPLGILVKEHLDHHFRERPENLGVRHVGEPGIIKIEDRQTAAVYDTWRISEKLQKWCDDFNHERPVSQVWLDVSLADDGVLEIDVSESTIGPIDNLTARANLQ